MTKIGFIGLGKLGAPVAEVWAEHYDVIGYDIVKTSANVPQVDSIEEVVKDRDYIFIAVQTPHDPEYGGETPTSHLPTKDFDYSVVRRVLTKIAYHAPLKATIVLISTCLPGTCRKLAKLLPVHKFVYNPYLIAMGTVKADMRNPDIMIFGGEDISALYDPIISDRAKTKICVGTWEEAESIKIFYNTWISSKIGLVNMIQDVAERVDYMDADIVTEALQIADVRITSAAYMKPGMGDGGACHPRDNIALSNLAKELDLGYDLFAGIMTAREQQAKNLADLICKKARRRKLPIVINGKAYKPGLDLIDGSYSLLVGHYINEFGYDVTYFDPNTGNPAPTTPIKAVILLAHETIYVDVAPGSLIIDVWNKYKNQDAINNSNLTDCEIITYGNTRRNINK